MIANKSIIIHSLILCENYCSSLVSMSKHSVFVRAEETDKQTPLFLLRNRSPCVVMVHQGAYKNALMHLVYACMSKCVMYYACIRTVVKMLLVV